MGSNPTDEFCTVKKPKTVVKCDQIQCETPKSKTPELFSWLCLCLYLVNPTVVLYNSEFTITIVWLAQ